MIKKHLIFFFLFFLILSVIIGCTDENDIQPPPDIFLISGEGFVSSDTAMKCGDSLKVGVDAYTRSDVNLTQFSYKFITDSLVASVDSGINRDSIKFRKMIIKSKSLSDQWYFIVRDKKGRSSGVSISIVNDTTFFKHVKK